MGDAPLDVVELAGAVGCWANDFSKACLADWLISEERPGTVIGTDVGDGCDAGFYALAAGVGNGVGKVV